MDGKITVELDADDLTEVIDALRDSCSGYGFGCHRFENRTKCSSADLADRLSVLLDNR